MNIDIGLKEQDRKNIAGGLNKLLADTYILYLKTQNFHWNVTGPQFHSLHAMFEEQYKDLAAAVDTLAERIRALGFPAPGSFKQFTQLTSIQEAPEQPPQAAEMIRQLLADQEAIIRTARAIYPHTDDVKDEATGDLITERLETHEKNAWMLRSCLD
jgi:starvation-inducible DNA-binding protein